MGTGEEASHAGVGIGAVCSYMAGVALPRPAPRYVSLLRNRSHRFRPAAGSTQRLHSILRRRRFYEGKRTAQVRPSFWNMRKKVTRSRFHPIPWAAPRRGGTHIDAPMHYSFAVALRSTMSRSMRSSDLQE